MVNNIAIIPARGGSKRISKKNICEFNNKPMIAWTIEAAKKSGLFSHIIVSTDDEEIADISKKYEAEVPFLRDNYSDDHSPVSLATVNCLLQAQEHYNKKFEHVIQLMPNCPLRTCDDIINSYNYFISSKSEFQISVSKFGGMNPWWAAKNKDGKFDFIFHESVGSRSQDLDDLYCPTGAIWIAKAESLIQSKSYYTAQTTMCEISLKSAVDIDDYNDLDIAISLAPSVYK